MPSPYQLLQKTPQKQNLIELLDYNEIFACGRVIIHQCLRNIPLGEKGKKKKHIILGVRILMKAKIIIIIIP